MKKKLKVILAVVVVLILVVPIPTRYKDGGSVRYRALLYDITKYHQYFIAESETGTVDGWKDGWDIRIIGIPVYNNFD